MSNFLAIKDHLIQSIPDIENVWIEETNPAFRIMDYKGQSYILRSIDETNAICIIEQADKFKTIDFEIEKTFLVQNVEQVIVVPIDGKTGLLQFNDSYCDVVIFDKYDFCFIEFKLNTSSSSRKVAKNRHKAVNQLTTTIHYFDEKLQQDYKSLQLEAYICTPDFYPKEDAEWENIRVEFLEETGIRLYETREKTCK